MQDNKNDGAGQETSREGEAMLTKDQLIVMKMGLRCALDDVSVCINILIAAEEDTRLIGQELADAKKILEHAPTLLDELPVTGRMAAE